MKIKNYDKRKNLELKKLAEDEGVEFKRFRTKTRSKRKNVKKDNRPLEVKR